MEQMTLLYIMAAFVLVSAIALCLQAAFLFGVYMTAKALQEKVNPLIPKVNLLIPKVDSLIPKVDSLLDSSKRTIDQTRNQLFDIGTKTNEILESTKSQLSKVDEVITDATSRAKVQLERVELVLDDTLSRAHETVATVHNGVIKPLREINAVMVGIRAALSFAARGGRPSPAQVTSDEEMFI